ncbi:MAG: ABC transporter permease [Saprospiraceae bacterium]|nr:MAG: ABC transporter permease [Saprospiraceae bacterium]
MYQNYLKSAWRNLLRNSGYSLINIGGLAIGMAVAMLIGLWIWDEVSFNKYHDNYDRLSRVIQNVTNNGEVQTWFQVPLPLAEELRNNYGSDFEQVVMASGTYDHILTWKDKLLTRSGAFFEEPGAALLGLKMIKGSREALKDPTSILLSESTAKAFFGDADPINESIKIDDELSARVAGVYEDIPQNSTFADLTFMGPWKMLHDHSEWMRTMDDPWRPNAFALYVQLPEHADLALVSEKIKDAKLKNLGVDLAKKKPELFLHPMNQWHLHSQFKNGINIGGKIKYVWLFGVIGVFVLLMACINFMNLSTARSEKRAKEVGVRKAVGGGRWQLISMFLGESLFLSAFSFVFSLLLVQMVLPSFNQVADKAITIPWNNGYFGFLCLAFILFTGLLAGSYPAFYLSSFRPVKVLAGPFKAGRWAAIPRKALIVLQFTVSVVLIIGTLIVFNQIEYVRNRPLGYNTNSLVFIPVITNEIHKHFEVIQSELIQADVITIMTESTNPPTQIWSTTSGISWTGKDPDLSVDFPQFGVAHDYGKTVGWQFIAGRDFSKDYATDSTGLILNKAAVQYMGLEHPIGETIRWFGDPYQVVGVVEDMVMGSPYDPVRPAVFYLDNSAGNFVLTKLNPEVSAATALEKIETVFKKFNPTQPFEYSFADEDFAKKFGNEQRIGELASFFAILAIFISCLGLFGLASFVAEQRTKEIGIRKVLGASIFNIWKLLSRDFIVLVIISCVIAAPIAYFFLQDWLEGYEYRTEISRWVFGAAGLGALMITVLTVSFQAIKAALANPVKSLRSE